MIAVLAVYSSAQDILSEGACVGGLFSVLVNPAVFCVAAIGLIVLAAKEAKAGTLQPWLKPFAGLCLSSATAFFIGSQAALRCTV